MQVDEVDAHRYSESVPNRRPHLWNDNILVVSVACHFFRCVSNSFRMRLYSSAQLVASTKP